MRFEHRVAFLALLFFSSVGWAAGSPLTPARKAIAVHVEPAEYPPIARRYNISGTVLAKMRIEPDGHVSKVEIVQSPADVLSEAVIRAARKWKYQPMSEALEGTGQFPFELTGDGEGYAFSTDLRSPATPLPLNVSDLGVGLKEGWSHIRLLIDGGGAVKDIYILKSSSDEFRSISKKIVSTLTFSPAPEGPKGYKSTSVNLFLIRVLAGGAILIDQKSGA